jgi:hypothetical protein
VLRELRAIGLGDSTRAYNALLNWCSIRWVQAGSKSMAKQVKLASA